MTLSELIPKPKFLHPKQIDRAAESLIVEYMRRKYGEAVFPVPTEALARIVERDALDFDLFADLSEREGSPEGVTDFNKGKKPDVYIDARLHDDPTEHRLRSTLAHEYGHVVLHDPLVQARWAQGSLVGREQAVTHSSYRPSQEKEPKGDLIEYQAWLFCGSLLMPANHLSRLVSEAMERAGLYATQHPDSDFGLSAIGETVRAFGVSPAIARIRLVRLDLLSEKEHEASLF